ncbi:hypothetical protein [Sphingomonas oligophenolica]|uniref:hypothetical protein n=1 Tax=Sphingomonas oligophenolica TaxID=301154 RepID=UPI001F4FD08C|nr:hypothetical protein [Sphingomonas oligophenolica]
MADRRRPGPATRTTKDTTIMMKQLAMLGSALVAVGGCSDRQSADANTTAAAATASPMTATGRVRGVVQTVGADALAIQTYDGQSVNVPLDAKTGFAWVVDSSLATLKDGDFIGTATTGPNDALRAVELVIFPESMRGTGEGHYDWDVPGVVAAAGGNAGASSAMTNGTVEQQSAMTNGTVTGGAGKPGETTLTISYKGGTSKVLVPVGTPIVRFEPTDRAILAKGQRVFAVTTPDAPGAKFVAVGKNGLTPPM